MARAKLGGFALRTGVRCVVRRGGGFLAVGHLEGPTGRRRGVGARVVARASHPAHRRRAALARGRGDRRARDGSEADRPVASRRPLLVGLLCNHQAKVFRSRWLWAGVACAIVVGTEPRVAGDARVADLRDGFEPPIRALGARLRDQVPVHHAARTRRVGPAGVDGGMVGAVDAPAAAALPGLRGRVRCRVLRAWIVLSDRFYYLIGLYPVLFAAGATVVDQVVDGERWVLRAAVRAVGGCGVRAGGPSASRW